MDYKWLNSEPGPKMITEGLKFLGTHELKGADHNPVILGWAKELGLQHVYKADEIPWCGLVQAILCVRAGKTPVESPLWALNWAKFGDGVSIPMLGDTLVFKRPGGGHVGLYVGEDKDCYHVMAGNQGDSYSIARILKIRLFAARRPQYKNQPVNVRVIRLQATGAISANEK